MRWSSRPGDGQPVRSSPAPNRYTTPVDVNPRADLRSLDQKIKESARQIAALVKASGSTLTEVFGVGPIIAGRVVAEAGDVGRFPDADHFASYNGTAPIEASSGEQVRHRLSRQGNRRLNHAIHMAAVTQIRQRHSAGRAYYERKRLEGKSPKELCGA